METTSLVFVYGIIYKVTNLINNMVYIGQTKNSLEDRRFSHENPKKGKIFYFQKAILKYGKENFKWEIIDSAFSKSYLNYKEKYWILFYHSFYDKNLKLGYNRTKGGDGGDTFSLMSPEQKEKVCNKISNSLLITIETIKNSGNLFVDNHGCNNPMFGKKQRK